MDDRQTKIEVGAGLQESRLNQDFLDFLRKWSSPVLFTLAGVSLAWWLWTRHVEQRAEHRGDAFRELDTLRLAANPSPESLLGIAEDYDDVRGVPEQAWLAAADEYMRAVRRGVFPGSELNPDGTPQSEADLLTDEDRDRFLGTARELYQRAADATDGTGMELLHLSALSGLAAVDEARGNADGARAHLGALIALAEAKGFPQLAGAARVRVSALDADLPAPRVYSQAELPKPPEPEASTPTPEQEPAASGDAVPPDASDAPEFAPAAEAPAADAPAFTPAEPATDEGSVPSEPEPAAEPPSGGG